MEHIAPRGDVGSFVVGSINIFKDQPDRQKGILFCPTSGGAADVSFYRMSQRIHAGGGSDGLWKADRNPGVKHRITRDQREIIDGVFMPGNCVRNDGCQGSLASGSGSGGNRDQQRQTGMYLQDTLHLGEGIFRLGDPDSNAFRAVYTGTAAESDDGVAAFFQIQGRRCFHIRSGRIRNGPVVDRIRDVMFCERLFQTLSQSKLHNAGIRDDQHISAFFLFDQVRESLYASHNLGLPIRQEGNGDFQYCLKCSAIEFSE